MPTNSLVIQNLGKRFNQEWLFDDLSVNVSNNETIAITGHNGSGKSTLLKIIAGLQLPTKGTVSLNINSKSILAEDYYRYLAFASPYIELIEEYTLVEMLQFYFHLKPLNERLTLDQLPQLLLLENASRKEIRSFSSGMKQRLKLGLALFCNVPLLILDEPTSHLDEQGKEWFYENLKQLVNKKIILIASNQEEEIKYCSSRINIPSYSHATHRS